ncbi:MAG: hypothetical protein II865_10425 [Bacteroidales bacterium]|nr:hypothetical protein [Bacteroidales bacterium]
MKEVKVSIDGVLSVHHVPESYDELSREQLLTVCSSLGGALTESALYTSLTGICKETWEEIPFPKRYFLKRLFDFLSDKEPAFSKQLLPWVEADGVRYIGYQPSFSNTTWEEFIYADGYMLSGRFREAAAVLYRPQRDDYTGETDRRVPFTIYGADIRMKHLAHLSDDQLAAFVLCYKTLRERNLVKRYPNVFARSPKRRKTSPSQRESAFSWVSVHRDLMGDRFYEESKFFASNVHVILNRLDRVIREGGRK